MKHYERELLNNLVGGTNIGDEEPLKNVKKALGSLSSVVGNPMFKAEITFQISLFFDDLAGNAILPAALPGGSQTSVPIYLFGLTDFYGAFQKSAQICPTTFGWVPSGAINSLGIFGIDVFGVPAGVIAVNGDLICQYFTAPIGARATAVVHCNNVAYGTFLNSFVSDLITVSQMRLIVPGANINQFINPLIFGYQTLFGKLSSDTVDPRMYKTPSDFQNQIADIPVAFPVDKNLMISYQLDVFCQQMFITLFVQKVEPLTHK